MVNNPWSKTLKVLYIKLLWDDSKGNISAIDRPLGHPYFNSVNLPTQGQGQPIHRMVTALAFGIFNIRPWLFSGCILVMVPQLGFENIIWSGCPAQQFPVQTYHGRIPQI